MIRIAFILFILISSVSFGQTNIEGTWKSTNGLARHIYTFDSLGNVKMEFRGDLMYYFLDGEYSISNNAILLKYKEPNEEEKKVLFRGQTPQLTDTIYISNNEKLEIRKGNLKVYLYNKDRDLSNFSIDSTGNLCFKVRDFGDNINLVHIRNYQWKVIESWQSPYGDYLEVKDYKLPLHSGVNEFYILVNHPLRDETIKRFEIESEKEKVNVKVSQKTQTIEFSDSTYYTLRNAQGLLVSEGNNKKLDNLSLTKGIYFLEFDNQWKKIKIKK